MSRCDAELCPHWTGQGCICDVLDLRDDDVCGHCLDRSCPGTCEDALAEMAESQPDWMTTANCEKRQED